MTNTIKTALILSGLALHCGIAEARYYPATEAQCTALDIREDFPMKQRNQDHISWCYAYTGADFLQFQFRLPEQVSTADMAISYNQYWLPRIIDRIGELTLEDDEKHVTRIDPPQTGFEKWALQKTIREGYCPERVFPSETWIKQHANGTVEKVGLQAAVREILYLVQQAQAKNVSHPKELPFSYIFEGFGVDDFYTLVNTSTPRTFLNNLRETVCEKHRKPLPEYEYKVRMHIKGLNTFNRIHRILDTRYPVTVDFFSEVLENLDQYSHRLGSMHTVLIMGRRWNKTEQECEYLMRDTYSEDCNQYDKRIDCDRGNLWMPESRLYRAMTSLVYFDPDTHQSNFVSSLSEDASHKD